MESPHGSTYGNVILPIVRVTVVESTIGILIIHIGASWIVMEEVHVIPFSIPVYAVNAHRGAMHVKHLELMKLISRREYQILAMRPFHHARTDDRRRRTPHLIIGAVVLHHKHLKLLSGVTYLQCLRIINTQIYLLMRL